MITSLLRQNDVATSFDVMVTLLPWDVLSNKSRTTQIYIMLQLQAITINKDCFTNRHMVGP